jgi:hypothetical protein
MAGVGRHDAWSDYELSLLYGAVNDIDWFSQVAPFIDRSETAIRTRMSALRREAGIVPLMHGPRAQSTTAMTRNDAAAGSARLRRAIAEMVAA